VKTEIRVAINREAKNPRHDGCILPVIGVTLIAHGVFDFQQQIEVGARRLDVAFLETFGGTVSLGMGLVCALLGEKARQLFGNPRNADSKLFLLLIPLGAIAIAVDFYVRQLIPDAV
jgi:hypothetical protein